MKNFLKTAGAIALCAFLFWTFCNRQREPLIEVRCVKVHLHQGGWNDPFSHAIYERTDTGERIFSLKTLGTTGEVFKVKLSNL